MIDPNTITNADQTAEAAKAVVTQWWPTLCLAAALVSRELKNFNEWVVRVAEFIIRHGGVATLICKLIWNPPVTASRPPEPTIPVIHPSGDPGNP